MIRTVLIIDDEPNMRWVLGRALEQAGYSIHGATSGDEGLGMLAHEPVDLVLLDLKLKGEDGLTVLRRIRERRPDLVVIMLTAYGTVPNAVEAMQLGAADFLRKPFDVEEVTFKIARALERRAMQQELARLTVMQRSAPAFDTLIGAAVIWQHLLVQARQVAATDHSVVLIGEAGSGRTSLARAMHVASTHHDAPLVELDLRVYRTAAQEVALFGKDGDGGAWAEAGNGSLILRGVVEATALHKALHQRLTARSSCIGPRLLVVASEAAPLPDTLATGIPVQLRVPPLRERPGDMLLLAHHFARAQAITPLASQLLEYYDWPENVTELRGVIRRASQLAGAGPIDVAHLPEQVQAAPGQASRSLAHLPAEGVDLEQVERTLIRQALERAHGNKSKAAELLRLTRHTLLYRMEKYGIRGPDRS